MSDRPMNTAAVPRRIDITIERINEAWDGMSEADRERLAASPLFAVIQAVCGVRAMERAEGFGATDTLADVYDRVVEPGGSAMHALLRVFKAAYATGPEVQANIDREDSRT